MTEFANFNRVLSEKNPMFLVPHAEGLGACKSSEVAERADGVGGGGERKHGKRGKKKKEI